LHAPEIGIIANGAQNFTTIGNPKCTFGAPGDPCLELWYQGKGPYLGGGFDIIKLKSSVARNNETDVFMFGSTAIFKGFFPGRSVAQFPPNQYNFVQVLMQPRNNIGGTVKLRSNNPRDTPIINFNYFAEGGKEDLQAMAEGIEFGRKVFRSVDAPVGPFTEVQPCTDTTACSTDVDKDYIKTQAWSHHASGSCKMGADNDTMAVLDSQFRVRGVKGLRVVDASVFPVEPGAFPVLPISMISEKATDVILDGLKKSA
jgi:choline dehydrogenase